MRWCLPLIAACLAMPLGAGAKQTVCTVTVNSADEKEVFRRYLPASAYEFVELVEPGRPDWLASSCQAATRCDVLVVSGHFDGDNEFFSDAVDRHEFVTVSELERASCSASCPSLFAQLKEVYLFGCNTLNPRSQSSVSAEVVRESVRLRRSPGEADGQLKLLGDAGEGQSSRDRMRQLFAGVPVIYGFTSSAPLGPTAAVTLERYLRQHKPKIGAGRADPGLLRAFSVFALSSAAGAKPGDAALAARGDMCRFADERVPVAGKLDFVHQLMRRHDGGAARYLDRIQRLAASLDERLRAQPAVERELAEIAADASTRAHVLASARAAAQAPTRVRLINLARQLGWLSEDQRWQELALMLGELQSRTAVGISEIDLACRLNDDGELDGAFARRVVPGGSADTVPHAAMRACLGSAEGRARTLDALASASEADVQAAQAYLRRRPITDEAELRQLTRRIAEVPPGEAQVRALEVLARHYVADREVMTLLADLYTKTASAQVQDAIAGVLIRADRRSIDEAGLLQLLARHRQGPAGVGSMVDALLARLDGR
ncbi:MAG: hypothetical protein ACOZJX_12610 [Pseudomonadota bacterium]